MNKVEKYLLNLEKTKVFDKDSDLEIINSIIDYIMQANGELLSREFEYFNDSLNNIVYGCAKLLGDYNIEFFDELLKFDFEWFNQHIHNGIFVDLPAEQFALAIMMHETRLAYDCLKVDEDLSEMYTILQNVIKMSIGLYYYVKNLFNLED